MKKFTPKEEQMIQAVVDYNIKEVEGIPNTLDEYNLEQAENWIENQTNDVFHKCQDEITRRTRRSTRYKRTEYTGAEASFVKK